MKKNHILAAAALIVCSSVILSSFKTTGGHPSSTGAPGELTCANATTGCHSNASVTNDNNNTVNTLIFSSADSSYVPGQTYTITLKTQKTGISKFGFEIVALRNTGNTNAGTWIITDAARTHTITGTGSMASRKYVTHSTPGTPAVSPGLGQWSFNWKAPSTNIGNITFYYATNCTNNNGANTGDQLFLSSFQIHPSTGTSVAEWINDTELQAYIHPATHQLILNYEVKKECEISLKLYDMQGRTVENQNLGTKTSGQHCESMDLKHSINNGVYFVNIMVNNHSLARKMLLQ